MESDRPRRQDVSASAVTGAAAWTRRMVDRRAASTEGERLLDELARHAVDPANELRLVTRAARAIPAWTSLPRRSRRPGCAPGPRRSSPAPAQMFFTRAGLEQASSERMARHHAARFAPFASVVDLCTGIGGDLIGLSENARGRSAWTRIRSTRGWRASTRASTAAVRTRHVCVPTCESSS